MVAVRGSVRAGFLIAMGGVALVAALVLGSVRLAEAGTPPPAGESRTVLAGSGEPEISIEAFLPATVEITAGGSVTWTNPWFEPHTVTFTGGAAPPGPESPEAATPSTTEPNPQYTGTGYLNSGFFFRDQSFTVTFPEAGTFEYLCIIHPGMVGTVVVNEAGADVPSQAEVDAQGQAELQPLLEQARARHAELEAQQVQVTDNGDGTKTYTIMVGSALPQIDFMAFFPDNVDIQAGDTVRWYQEHLAPHTVTFGELQGPPDVPAVPAQPWDGTGFVNSGEMFGGSPMNTFSLTFGAPGTYSYICIFHADQQMVGTVTVAAAGGGAAPPAAGGQTGAPATGGAPAPARTGAGPDDDRGISVGLAALGAAALAVMGGAAVWSTRRRAL